MNTKDPKKCLSSNKILCGKEDCDICFNRSLASYTSKTYKGKLKIDCWTNKKLTPIYIKKDSSNKYLFNCDECGSNFINSSYNITVLDMWCPYCSEGNIF